MRVVDHRREPVVLLVPLRPSIGRRSDRVRWTAGTHEVGSTGQAAERSRPSLVPRSGKRVGRRKHTKCAECATLQATQPNLDGARDAAGTRDGRGRGSGVRRG